MMQICIYALGILLVPVISDPPLFSGEPQCNVTLLLVMSLTVKSVGGDGEAEIKVFKY